MSGSFSRRVIGRSVALAVFSCAPLAAQIPASEFAARRDSLAARVGEGVVVAFGGRTLVNDFGTFFQLPAFHYLTNFDEPDAAFVMVIHRGQASSALYVSPINPRTAFYYGQRTDTSGTQRLFGLHGRPIDALAATLDVLAQQGLPFYTLADFEDADFARSDSLTRGQTALRALSAKYPALVVRNAHPIVAELRARKTPAE